MLILLLALASAASPPETDMLAQFKAGRMLCSNPDSNTKTCSTIDRLTLRADGVMIDTGETLLALDKPVTLEVASVAHFEAGALCGTMDVADLRNGIVRADGVPLPADRNALALEKLTAALQPLAGRKICEGLRLQDGQLVKIGQAERFDLPLPGKPVRWIMPDEGYRVAPRPQ